MKKGSIKLKKSIKDITKIKRHFFGQNMASI